MNTYFDLDNAEVVVDPVKTVYGYESSIRNCTGHYRRRGQLWRLRLLRRRFRRASVRGCEYHAACLGDGFGRKHDVYARGETDDDGNVYLYTGTALSRTERSAQVRLLKIDALTGEILWECQSAIKGKYASKSAAAGSYAGLMASPLVG
ncbi:MAG: hypothetical protein ACLUI3_11405 [Christensenellales bacterium]